MCPPDDTIAALLEGRLAAKEAAAVHAHAAGCELCRQLIAEGARARSAVFRPRPPSRDDATEASQPRGGAEDEEGTEERAGVEEREDSYWDVKTQGPLPKGFSVGRYTVLEHLASGGMGSVYAAYDPDLDRRVALKVIATTSKIGADDLRWRLLREAQAMARLSHPNVAVVHEVGTISGQVFLAMEYVEGVTLREWLNQRARTWQEILGHFVQAGRGLAAAHAGGLVHRDFKPDNVLIGEDGRVRVVDFGLVRPRENSLGDRRSATLSTPLTAVGTLLGTPRYMAPEQMRSKTPDGRADQFSFCVALYEALYRVRPFEATSLHERLQQIDRGAFAPPPPGHGVPERIGAAVRRGLNPEPARRFRAMDDLLSTLEGVLQPARGRWRLAGAMVTLAVAAGVVAGGWALWQRRDGCAAGDARLRQAWDSAQRATVPLALGPGTAALDAYATRWKVANARACTEPRPRTEPAGRELAARLSCLDRALMELRGAAVALSRGDPGALARVGALPEPATCLDITATGVPAPPARKDDLLGRLAVLQARQETGATPVHELRALAEEAASTPAVQAQAFLALGRAEARAHPREPLAEEALHRAAATAQLAQDDATAARAWLELGALCVRSPGRTGEARRWAVYAAAAAARTARMGELGALAHQVASDAALAEGRVPEALQEHRTALELLRARPVPEDPVLAAVLLAGVPLQGAAGRPQEAVAEAAAAARIRQLALRDHPLVAEALITLSNVEAGAGSWADAERDQAHAVAILDKTLDPADLRVVRARVRLGGLRARAGAHRDAAALLGPAVGELERGGVVEPLELGLAQLSLGREQLLAGDAAGAAVTLQLAWRVLERSGPAGAAELPLTLASLGEARWLAGPKANAREPLEKAHAALPPEGGRPFDRAYAAFLLSRALFGTPSSTERARALAREGRAARAGLDATTGAEDRAGLERLDQWLQERKL
ncbi:MAG TPA: serine/threonine-protein kinase [Myxococcaceae bacterium]|jgi:tetratricopeptide (TPR) repeat protein/predicted Ser/Thr protein kinase